LTRSSIVKRVMSSPLTWCSVAVGATVFVAGISSSVRAAAPQTHAIASAPAQTAKPVLVPSSVAAPAAAAAASPHRTQMLQQYCSVCHNDTKLTANLSITGLKDDDAINGVNTATWEKILRRVSLGEMPPKGMRRPSPDEIHNFTTGLESSLDTYAEAHPDPGRNVIRRMNRAEYANAVRDLLDLKVNVASQLPADDSGYGFDNISAILSVSPTLMDRYVSVAGRVARQAVGTLSHNETMAEHTPAKDLNILYHGVPSHNTRASKDLPLLSRGGTMFQYEAPYDATYVVEITLNSNTIYDNNIEKQNVYQVRTHLGAGTHSVGVSFPRRLALDETPQRAYSGFNVPGGEAGVVEPSAFGAPPLVDLNVDVDAKRIENLKVPAWSEGPQFFQANFDRDVIKLAVKGPYDVVGQTVTPSQKKIFACRPKSPQDEPQCARTILTRIAGQAYRRPTTNNETAALMKVYQAARADGTFENGIEGGLQAILVSPQFLFMRESTPAKAPPNSVYRISDQELASRLSLFLWSSLPDRELLNLAAKNKLHESSVMKAQIRRMLEDPRATALTDNFAGQWLYLRALDYQRPDIVEYKNFDERLRQAMQTETSMFFTSILRENRSALDLIDTDYTFLNQRLAEHYGIPGVHGETFRRVKLDPAWHRGGLLGQGSILTVTSFNNRTSIVRRGKWILDNILVAPPPPPPPNIPALVETGSAKFMTVRQQMDIHRNNPVCASCHNKIDPLGFSLENYDAVGGWRTEVSGQKLDVSATTPDGYNFTGVTGLKTLLLNRKDQFLDGFIERLMTYALARGLEAQDMPQVRAIRHRAAADGYHMDAIIQGIVESTPFQKRKVGEPTPNKAVDPKMKVATR